jgi:sulfate transport system permease protein
LSAKADRRVLPGFRLSLGITLTYVSILIVIPLCGLLAKAFSLSASQFWATAFAPRALAAYKLSILASLTAATINAFAGLLIAWVLVRYRFPGRALIDALVDLPFALPTAVAGITLTALYAPRGWVGRFLDPLGLRVAFTPLGVVIALTFIGLPFVVRTVQPVLESLDAHLEEAAAVLGASRAQTLRHVILPSVLPAVLTGFTLAMARALGEYGSVVFISGNLPMRTEIPPLLIVGRLEEFDYGGAAALAVVMLAAAFALLLAANLLGRWTRRIAGGAA